jgi:hypothetical protein|tara:strand:+ start:120 stop:299 length:180 start_codon:yes stop_codon:yes gene_type:complete
MKDTLNILVTHPEIGITTSLGSGFIHWLGILNPILSFVSLGIGISIGLITLYGKLKDLL